MSFKITEIYAFVAVEDGDEGIPAMQIGPLTLPLVGADQTRVDEMRAIAQDIADATGRRMTLARFTMREDLETITSRTTH